ncbi:hypothetical protein HK097_000064 [Rhizophlyctis rosea]|uniref:Uncharacterized protein n=1 Tax=Rhizophlyctis rosea TaxID=64517 RepID=A0AAD5SKK1_9FUNG|nr:hypothetical protein HK097_000064 [Rhizophlyctis rosea]
MGDKPILEFLFDECNVHPMTQDSYGNTALHVLAWQGYYDTDEWDGMHQREEDDRKTGSESQKTRFIPSDAKLGGAWTLILQKVADRNGVCIVAELEDDVDPMRALNHDGLTPFLVAVERGNRHMVHAMIEAIGEVQRGCTSTYGFGAGSSQSSEQPQCYVVSTPQIHVRASQDVNLICGEPLFRSLLEAKWLYYARTIYFMYLFSTILYATLLTLVIILIPKLPPLDTETGQSSPNYISRWEYFTTTEGRWRFGFEIALMAINVARSAERLRSFPRRFWNLTFQSVLKAAYGLMNFNVWTNVLLAAVVIVCRIAGSMRAENVALGFAIIYAYVA